MTYDRLMSSFSELLFFGDVFIKSEIDLFPDEFVEEGDNLFLGGVFVGIVLFFLGEIKSIFADCTMSDFSFDRSYKT